MTTLNERLTNFTKEIKDQKLTLIKLKGVKEQLEKQIKEEQDSLATLQEEQKLKIGRAHV